MKINARAVLDPNDHTVLLDDLPPDQWPAAPSAEHEAIDAHLPSLRRVPAILRSAVDNGTITPVSDDVVWRTRILHDDEAAVATELGVGLRTLQRAERQLAGRDRNARPVVDEPDGTLDTEL